MRDCDTFLRLFDFLLPRRALVSSQLQFGGLLAEFAVALTFLGLVSLIVTQELSSGITRRKAISSEIHGLSAKLFLRSEIGRIVRALDRHPLFLPPHISIKGTVPAVDGSSLELSGSLSPHQESQALTFLSLRSEETLILNYHFENQATWRGCPLLQTTSSYEEPRFYIGIGGYGLSLYTGESERTSKGCRVLKLSPFSSSLFEGSNEPQPVSTLAAVVPVSEIATLYLTAEGVLRRISFSKEGIVENQPLASNLAPFRFLSQSDSHYQLDLLFENEHFIYSHSIGRIEPLLLATYLRQQVTS